MPRGGSPPGCRSTREVARPGHIGVAVIDDTPRDLPSRVAGPPTRQLVGADRFRSMSVEAEIVHETTDELVEAFARLLPQLSSRAVPLDHEAVRTLTDCSTNTLLVARVEGVIVGMLTLVMSPLPSGLRAHIEDVVVDAGARGHGVGRVLIDRALESAADAGARTVDLTSRPSREAANRLYERAGFQQRDSKVFRFTLE